jgi:hypothetical protein
MKTFDVVVLGLLMTTAVGCGTESPPTQQPAPRDVDKHELPYDIASRPMTVSVGWKWSD